MFGGSCFHICQKNTSELVEIIELKGSMQEADMSIFLVFAPIAYLCSTHADLSYK